MEDVRAILGSLEILEETKSPETKAAAAENIRRHGRILITKLQKIEADNAFLLREVKRLENALNCIAPNQVIEFIKASNAPSFNDIEL